MTKEEIRKEAEERVNICTPYHTGSFIQGYIAGAEPRENKIADIKANCDLAIEGRDIKIKELELELTVEKDQHQEEINLHLHAEDYIESLEKENAELKMKIYGGGYEMIITKKDADIILLEKENVELKHNKKTVAHLADCLEEKMKERIEELERLNSNQAESLRVTMLEEEKKGKRIGELEQQIEKMKCCGNCRFGYCERSSERIDKDGNRTFHCWNEEKEKYCDVGKNGKYQCWELKEIEK